MCQIKSAIILKDKTFCPFDYDDHSKMLEELGIKDNTKTPDFVRVEMNPKDGNIFNHDLDNWVLKVDQDFKPEWFSEKFAAKEMQRELKNWWQERFIFDDKSWKKLQGSKFYVKNSSVVAWENSSVVAWENSSVVARENSSVVAWENSSVVAWENSSVVARENSSVVAWGNSSVEARENSSVVARENSSVVAWGNSSVVARENSSVVAWENSSVVAWGNSQILIPYNWSDNVKIKNIQDLASVKDLRVNKIFVSDKKLKLAQFKLPKK